MKVPGMRDDATEFLLFLFFPQACPDRNDQHRAVHGITRFINDKPYDSGKIQKKQVVPYQYCYAFSDEV
jgi:hypothetical protein